MRLKARQVIRDHVRRVLIQEIERQLAKDAKDARQLILPFSGDELLELATGHVRDVCQAFWRKETMLRQAG